MSALLETTQYTCTKKKLLKKHVLNEKDIKNTLLLWEENMFNPIFHYKKMNCKKDKNRYSIRVLKTQYRILMTVYTDNIFLICICDHDDYDARNKDC